MKIGRVIDNIGLASLIGISLTCDSNNKTLASVIENQKPDIENTLTTPIDTHRSLGGNTRKIGYIISQHTADTLTLGDISPQDITTKDTINNDTIQIANTGPTNNITGTIQRGPNSNTLIDTSGKENSKKILSQEECNNLLDKQITKTIIKIVPETEKIKSDIIYMRGEVYSLFTHFFSVQDTEDGSHLIFSKIQKDDQIFVTQHMDNMKQHIKDNNGFWIKLLLTKGDLKDYIMKGNDKEPNIKKIYKTITNEGFLYYEGGESQFKKDVESVINLY